MKRQTAVRSAGIPPHPPATPGAEGPRSPLRAMHIVELLAGATRGLSLAAMTDALAIPKTSLLNHLRVLAGAGYVNALEGRYTLGPAALRLGVVIAADVGVMAAARPVLAGLAAASGETAMVATLDERLSEAVCIDVVEGEHDMRYAPRVGSRWPLYSTGMGRALLAFQDGPMVDAYLAGARLSAHTKATVTDRKRLRRLLDEVRERGVAVTAGEHTPGAGAVAAPVIERDSRVRHVVGIGLPVERLGARRAQLVQLVVDAAQRVSWTLGGRGSAAPWSGASALALATTAPSKRATSVRRPTDQD